MLRRYFKRIEQQDALLNEICQDPSTHTDALFFHQHLNCPGPGRKWGPVLKLTIQLLIREATLQSITFRPIYDEDTRSSDHQIMLEKYFITWKTQQE
jgi:hypothetical protein